MLKSTRSNEVAILGYGCRLPGADGPDAFWKVLKEGRCTVTEIQASRWPKEVFGHKDPAMRGKSYVWAAGQLDDPWGFDPDFFGVSPREAEQMDPQQRLILQVAWEALEHAGLPPSSLPKDRTGVYIGASSSDYSNRFYLDPASIDSQFMTGNSLSLISNRLSYVLDLHGPSQTVDTACSSGIYALHYAVQALRAGLIDTAIVGAVNMLLSPFPFIGFSRASMLSKTGLCRAFDADGDGYVRSEGATVFILRAEHAAIAEGDRIRGYVAATGVNTDGRTPGVSQPSADRQAALLRSIYEEGDIDPNDLAFVEAHGTGTAVGDPIEASAIGSVLGVRRDQPLPIGSVKTNVGHLEAGAGMVGLLKAQMALEFGAAPQSLHFDTPNPNIDFEALNLRVVVSEIALPMSPEVGRPRLAGVNSFGFGGANGHAVLRQAATGSKAGRHAAPGPLILSARSEESLANLANLYAKRLSGANDAEAADIANAAAYQRERLPHRLVAPSKTRSGQIEALAAYAADPASIDNTAGEAGANATKTAFIFSGNGAQWVGMGREAHRNDPVFRATFEKVSEIHSRRYDIKLTDALHDPALEENLAMTSLAQPLLLGVQAGLVESLAHSGLRPHAVLGHSVGEVAAAWAAGIYSLEDAVRLIGARSASQEMLRGLGLMAAVAAPADEIAARLAAENLADVWIAADNSPLGATVSASATSMDAFEEIATAAKWSMRRLELDYPFHSGFADPMRDDLVADLAWLKPEEARIEFVSSAYGRVADGHELGPAYWWKNIRAPVRFRDGVDHLVETGCGVFIEIGPKPVLRGYIRDCLASHDATLRYSPTLTEAGGDVKDVVARALALGAQIDETRFFGVNSATRVDLPRYPWRNRRYRVENTVEATPLLQDCGSSPLLGQSIGQGAHDWRREIDPTSPSYFADHVIHGAIVAPAAAMIEMAFAAGAETLDAQEPLPPCLELKNFTILRPIALDGGARELRVTVSGARSTLSIETRRRLSDEAWSPAAAGRLRRCHAEPPVSKKPPACDHPVASASLYAALEKRGLCYGPAFQLAREVAIEGPTAASVLLAAPEEDRDRRHLIHPASLDAALHGLLALLQAQGSEALFLPVSVETARLFRRSAVVGAAQVSVTRHSSRSVTADIVLLDTDGGVVASFEKFRFKVAPGSTRVDPDACRYETRLVPLPDAEPSRDGFDDVNAWGISSGHLSGSIGSPRPAELIAEAAAQRVCLDAIRESDGSGPILGRLRRLAESQGLLERGADGQLEEVVPSAPPALAPLFEALIAEAPRSAGLIAYLSRLSVELSTSDDENTRPTRAERAALELDQATEDRWRALTDFALAVLAREDVSPGLSVLVLGAPPTASVRALSAASLLRLWIVDPLETGDPAGNYGGAAQRRKSSALPDGPKFDLILICAPASAPTKEMLAMANASISPGGLLFTSAPPEGVLTNLVSTNRFMNAGPPGLEPISSTFLTDSTDTLAIFRRPVEADIEIKERNAIHFANAEDNPVFAAALCNALHARHVPLAPSDNSLSEIEVMFFAWPGQSSDEVAEQMMAVHPWFAASPQRRPTRVWIVTNGGAPGGDGPCNPGAAAIWGFARVLANEQPEADIRLVDLDPSAIVDDNVQDLAGVVARLGDEHEIAIRGRRNFALRVQQAALPLRESSQLQLAQAKPGDIESLAWASVALNPPTGDEVQIDVAATGLNFRDVMWAQRLLPEEALEDGFAGPTLGMECAGVVTAVGPDVTRLRPGDKVIAYAPACFAQRVVTTELAASPVPEGIDLEVAASMPTAFLTAQYALVELARVRAGETVLIHGAAGGVGIAAIQIAMHLGARVIATAGSPSKRALARQLGAEAVFDGRSLGFAEEVLAVTHGVGVDVVLNSLAGEAMERGVECLKPFGRFIELGKRDFFADSELGLRPFRRNLSYFGVDADQMMKDRPELAMRLLTDLCSAFSDGALTPPPATIFDAEDVVDAFRLMQKSGHIGKILIRPPGARMTAPEAPEIRHDASYLIVGGVSGFGAATAMWLVEQGARNIHLASRTASPDQKGAVAIARMRETGALVTVHAADVADENAMRRLLEAIDSTGAPLTGIVHAAMVLDDALFTAQDLGRIERVLRPKIDGANVLDRLTRARDAALDFLIVYSSATTLVGNPGQTAYVAANAYLEALMRNRRLDGHPGLAIAWGAVTDTGVLAREATAEKALATRLGSGTMTASDALAELGRLIGGAEPVRIFGEIDWQAARRELNLIKSNLFERIDIGEEAVQTPSGELIDHLRGLAPAEALVELVVVLTAEAARILRMPAGEIDPAKPLTDMGFDSLMAMDLRMALEERLGLEVPLMSLAGGATLRDVGRLALDRLDSDPDEAVDGIVELVVERHVSGSGDGVSREDVERFAERAKSTESLLS